MSIALYALFLLSFCCKPKAAHASAAAQKMAFHAASFRFAPHIVRHRSVIERTNAQIYDPYKNIPGARTRDVYMSK